MICLMVNVKVVLMVMLSLIVNALNNLFKIKLRYNKIKPIRITNLTKIIILMEAEGL